MAKPCSCQLKQLHTNKKGMFSIILFISQIMLCIPFAQTQAASSWLQVPVNADPMLQNLTIPASAPTKGMWSSVQPWPMNGLHSVLLPNGKVLSYGTTADGNTQDGRTMDVWDPALGFGAASHKTTFRADQVNSFCGAATFLPNGQLMATGGNSPIDSALYSPADDTSSNSTYRLADERWYATLFNLPDSRSLIVGGMNPYSEGMQDDPNGAVNAGLASMTPEVFNPTSGWQSLFGAYSREAFGPDYLRASYPRAWVAPSGNVFGISAETLWTLNPNNNGSIVIHGRFKQAPGPNTAVNVGATNTAVMFAPGKILVAGGNGSFNGEGWPASKQVTLVDINNASPVLTEQTGMTYPRRFPNSIIMPNGQVLITGGTTVGNNNGANAVYSAEIWNPSTGTWSVAANAAIYRGYHSFTTLLPNGAVLSTGGGTPGPVTNLNAEIYYPPYLFQNVNGVAKLAARPEISAIGGLNFANNGTLELDMATADTVSQLVLIGNSSGTHSFNAGQRRIPLSFSQSGLRLTATVPNANLAPPGYYQVLAIDTNGVPSTGVIVSIGAVATPNMPLDLPRGNQVTIRSVNLNGQVIGVDTSGLAVLQTLSTTAPTANDLATTTFITRDGFANPNCVSFEYAATPGKFLRHANYRLQLAGNDGSAIFKADATFCPELGLSGLGATFRSTNFQSYVLRHRTGQIWLDPTDGSSAFNDSASFFVQQASAALPSIPAISAPLLASGGTANFSVAAVAAGAQYSWNFGDGSTSTAFATSAAATHQYTQPGLYLVTLNVRLADGTVLTKTFVQGIYPAKTTGSPVASAAMVLETRSNASARLWVVNPDNNSVSVLDTSNNSKITEINVGAGARTLAIAPSGDIWVVNKEAASLSIISAASLTLKSTVALPRASQPYGLVFAPNASAAYVVLEASGLLLKLDPATGATLSSVAIGPRARHLSMRADSSAILVSRFITPALPGEGTTAVDTSSAGAEVLVINPSTLVITKTITLQHSDKTDTEIQGSGIPNYLAAPVISPDGSSAWVPSKQDNIKRGVLRNGLGLDFQNTVRAISSRIDMATLTEDYGKRVDHDNSSLGSAAAYHPSGIYLFVALETSRQIAVVNALAGKELFKVDVGRAPQAVTVSADGLTLYVQNFMDRSVSVLDLKPLIQNGEFRIPTQTAVNTVAVEKLSAQVLTGKQHFYDAKDTRLARDAYMSCASCHNDGGHDGRVWDLTGFGEGLRNTIALKGRAGMGQGFLHWSANFDEVQDFEKQIRTLSGGTGLMTDAQFNTGTRNQALGDKKAGVSADLDALAAYLGSLSNFDQSPYRSGDGSLSTAAIAGKAVFQAKSCGTCHSGNNFTNSTDASTLSNIGTLKPSSGQRLGAALTGLDVPTLRDVWSTGPYLHDGSAPTLAVAIQAHQSNTITGTDLSNLVAYLQQIGQEEPAPGSNLANGVYRLVVRHSGQALDVAGKSTAIGANVDQQPWAGGDNQRWKLTNLGNGEYTLVAQHSGQVLEVAGCAITNGGNVQQYTANNAACQVWRIENLGDGSYRLVNKNSGKVLDVSGISTAAGANVHQWDWHGGNNQRWQFDAVSPNAVAAGTYRITPAHNSQKALDVYGASKTTGANVIQWVWTGGNNQRWIVSGTADGYFELTPAHATNQRLEVAQASLGAGGNVQQGTSNSSAAQRWSFEALGNGVYRVANKNSGKFLEVNSCANTNGANVQQGDWFATKCQQWGLTAK